MHILEKSIANSILIYNYNDAFVWNLYNYHAFSKYGEISIALKLNSLKQHADSVFNTNTCKMPKKILFNYI